MNSLDIITPVSYQNVMLSKIQHYSPNLSVQRVLEEKAKRIAEKKLGDLGNLASYKATYAEINQDFDEAVAALNSLEEHAFHIEPPADLTLSSLQNQSRLEENQSIMHHCVRSADALMIIAKAFGKTGSIRDIIPLTVERLVQHNLIRRFVLNFCPKAELESELNKIIRPLAIRVLQEDSRFKNMGILRDDCQSNILAYLQNGEKNNLNNPLVQIVETLKRQAESINSELSIENRMQAIAMRASDLIIETYVKEIVDHYDMHKASELAGYRDLPPQTKETRHIYMINGGVASGKSSAKKLQDNNARKEGIDPETICSINRDAFKHLLLQPNEVSQEYQQFFASLTEDEAYLLRDSILREYKERLANNTAPHLYIDQVSPTVEMLKMAGTPDSRGMDLTIVYSPIELAFCLAEYREKITGNGAVTAGVLTTHANVSKQLIGNIKEACNNGCNNIRLKIVANVAQGVLKPVADINYASKTGKIEDTNHLLAFFHKQHIKRNATRFSELYDNPHFEGCTDCSSMASQLMEGINTSAS